MAGAVSLTHPIVWIVPMVIFAATIAAFWPATANEFVNWDDHRNFLQNRDYRGFGPAQIGWAFTTGLLGVYQPLSWIALSAQYVIFELKPSGYHATSIVLHAATAVVFFVLLLKLLPRVVNVPERGATVPIAICAGIATAAYALHPLRVEPVAWASSQPYVLAMLFYLITLLCYVMAAGTHDGKLSWPWYAAAIVAYICCVFSKAIGVTLPVVLLLMDLYPLRRVGGAAGWSPSRVLRVFLEKLPFFALAAVTAAIAKIATATNDPMSQTLHVGHRIMLAFFGLAFYVYKTLVPTHLLPYYPIPRPFNPLELQFLIAAGVVVLLTVLFLLLRRRFPGGMAAWVYYVVVLVPVLGIVQHGSQIAADRYAYLSCLVWPMMAGAALLWLWCAKMTGRRAGMALVPALVVAMLAVTALAPLTWAQTKVWSDSITLWTHVLDHAGPCDYAHNNLGTAYEADGARLGAAGKLPEAEARAAEALAEYRRAVEIEPLNYRAQRNLGAALNLAGKPAEAEPHLRAAIDVARKADMEYANAYNSLGVTLDALGRREEAIQSLKKAISIGRQTRNEIAEPYINLANIYLQQDGASRMNEVVDLWKISLRLNPSLGHIRKNLAAALGNQKHYEEAIRVLEDGLASNRNDAHMAANLAWMLSTAPNDADRDGPRAVRLAEAAVKSQTTPNPQMLNALAAAYAEVGRYSEAFDTLQRAINIANQRGEKLLVDQLAPFLPYYRAQKPVRMPE